MFPLDSSFSFMFLQNEIGSDWLVYNGREKARKIESQGGFFLLE